MQNIQILVSSLRIIHANDRREIGRYYDIVPFAGRTLIPGTCAEFISKDGTKARGRLIVMTGDSLVLDTFDL